MFAPPIVVEVPPVVPLRTRGAATVRRPGMAAARAVLATVTVLVVAAVLAALAISYGALTLGTARMTTAGTMIPPFPAEVPVNALPAGTVVTATPGVPVKVGAARLLEPAIGDTAQLMILGPISESAGLAGYEARCVGGACQTGDLLKIHLDEIAGTADSGVGAWQWFTARADDG